MARTDRPGEAGGGGGGTGGFSYRASELRPVERRAMAEQNRSAESLKNKNLDAVDRATKGAETRKNNQLAKEEYAHNAGIAKGKIKGAAVGLAAGVAADEIARAIAKKKETQGTQAGHAVTSGKNTTKPVK